MMLSPRVRKAGLVLHIGASVGWLGAAAVFVVLALIGTTSSNEATVRGVYLVMEPAARLVLLPLAVASLLTGIVQALITRWGLLRHYWVIVKLGITAVWVAVLYAYLATFEVMAQVAADPTAGLAEVRNSSPVLHGAAAVLGLLTTLALSVFKPRGTTRYGWRKAQLQRSDVPPASSPAPAAGASATA